MLPAERKQFILDRLHQTGKLVAAELSAALGISEDTVRRDLRELSEAGLLQRVHGGALPASPAATATYTDRQQQSPAAKAAIARAALPLLHNGQVVLLDGGTTTLQVAQQLPSSLQITVITNSPPIAIALASHPRAEVLLIGGKLLKPSLVSSGAAAVEAIQMIRADLCFLGICSLHPELGISTPDSEEALVKRAMIASSAEVVALVSAEKMGTAAPYIVAPIQQLTHLVTEARLPQTALEPYRRMGITILLG
ncbi:MAG: DeoR/GlpR transcriptional regulator [Anaerolineales bacterium]|nr:DeoR/GlpR transcriptional regulator [Anaerolineales bacterium]